MSTLLAIFGAAICNAAPVKVGAFIEDPGSDSAARKAFVEGAMLAVEKQSSQTITVQAFPASSGRALESTQLKTLVETDHAPVALYWSVDEVTAAAPYLNESDVIGLVGFEVTKQIRRLGAKIFGFGYTTEGTFEELAKYAGKKLKSYRFALISSADARFETQRKSFSEETKSLGNTVVFDEKVGTDDSAFASLAARAAKEKCDTIFAALPAASLAPFLKAVRGANFKGRVLIGDTLTAAALTAIGKDAEGIYLVQAWSDDAAFRSSYVAKYGSTPDNVTLGFAALGYDAVSCIASAPAPLDSRSISDSMLSTPCEGLTGRTGFTGERMAQRKKRILTVRGGQFAAVD